VFYPTIETVIDWTNGHPYKDWYLFVIYSGFSNLYLVFKRTWLMYQKQNVVAGHVY